MTKTIDNTDDVIDSRDVIARIEELEGERQEIIDRLEALSEECEAGTAGTAEDTPGRADEATTDLEEWDKDNREELEALKDLASEGEDHSCDWSHGETLIRESYWTEYVQELLKDCGDLPKDIPHYVVIDWEATAKNIAKDYAEISYDGVTYYIRNS